MIITRTLYGKEITIELTPKELDDAHFEVEFSRRRKDLSKYIDDRFDSKEIKNNLDFEKIFNRLNIQIIHNDALALRDAVNYSFKDRDAEMEGELGDYIQSRIDSCTDDKRRKELEALDIDRVFSSFKHLLEESDEVSQYEILSTGTFDYKKYYKYCMQESVENELYFNYCARCKED